MVDKATVERDNIYRFLSTAFSSKALLENFFPEAIYGDDTKWIDLFSPQFDKLMKLPRTTTFIYNNSVPITTHSAKQYRTTSFWWLLVACSEHIHPHQIPTNTVIAIPSLNDILSSLTTEEVYKGLRGKVVTI